METFSPTLNNTTTMKLPTKCDSISNETRPASDCQAIIIGIYGIPGSGKTFLINQLKQWLEKEPFNFWDGSQVIATFVPGGLVAFHKLEEEEKRHWRELAINKIKQGCLKDGKVAVVAGYLMFWREVESAG
jgi:GTPase SAR1 family protein